jgi:Zn-dependent protease
MGISVEVHIVFLLLLLIILLFTGIANFLFIFIVFSIVLAHELCHSVAAILSGIPVPRIVLLPFGGLATIELPENPITELKISASGPLFNFFFAAVGYLIAKIMGLSLLSYGQVLDMLVNGGVGIFTPAYVLSIIVTSNLILGLFNMLPAFPMDGGRVFRSVLALWMDYAKATAIAGRIGQLFSLLFIAVGILGFNLWWLVIGLFLTYASSSEVKFVLVKHAFEGLVMKDIMSSRRMPVVDGGLTLKEFFNLVARPDNRFYLVANPDGSLRGVLDLHQLAQNASIRADQQVSLLARDVSSVVDGRAPVADAMKQVVTEELTLVVDGGIVLGYVTPESFMESTNFYSLRRRQPAGA